MNLETKLLNRRWLIEVYQDDQHGLSVAVTNSISAITVTIWRCAHNATQEEVSNLRDWTCLPKTIKQLASQKLSKWERKLRK